MFKCKTEISGLKELEKKSLYVQKMIEMKTDTEFQKFIQSKVLEIANKVTNDRLVGGTTNDEAISIYKSSHHIKEEPDGFILYNDAKINANTKTPDNYPNGEFSIALAFEYGVGITGEGTYNSDKFSAWEYNKNNYNFGWYFKKNEKYEHTFGYMGFEIYRNIAIQVERKMKSWVNEYYSTKRGV